MSWTTELEELMVDGVSVQTFSSVSTDGYGTAVHTTSATTYQARHVVKQALVRTFAGTEELATAQTWVASTSTVSPHDKITVNGAVPGPLMAVQTFPDETGTHHIVLHWG